MYGIHDLLTAEEETSLGLRIQAGNQATLTLEDGDLSASERRQYERLREGGLDARNTLVSHNLRLVRSRAKRFAGTGREFDDLEADGMEALVIAAGHFDPAKGARFSTFAVNHINHRIQYGIDRNQTIAEPVRRAKRRRKLNRAGANLEVVSGREPSAGELADRTDISTTSIADLTRYDTRVATLDGGLEAPCRRLGVAEQAVVRAEIGYLLSAMSPLQAEAVRLVYGLDNLGTVKTHQEAADLLGVKRQAVDQRVSLAFRNARRAHELSAA